MNENQPMETLHAIINKADYIRRTFDLGIYLGDISAYKHVMSLPRDMSFSYLALESSEQQQEVSFSMDNNCFCVLRVKRSHEKIFEQCFHPQWIGNMETSDTQFIMVGKSHEIFRSYSRHYEELMSGACGILIMRERLAISNIQSNITQDYKSNKKKRKRGKIENQNPVKWITRRLGVPIYPEIDEEVWL